VSIESRRIGATRIYFEGIAFQREAQAFQFPNVLRGFRIELTSVMHALKVAEHLSFRRATEALGVCQSSVSKRVRALENLLGVDLFDRHHAGVKVTNAGRHFFEHIKMALDLDSTVTSAGKAGRVETGSAKIGLFSSLASGFLPELLRCYSAQHPEIDVSIVEGPPSENLALLCAEQLDVVFVMGEPVARDCDVARLWNERVFVVLPDTHALCDKDAIKWEDLKTEHFILTRSEVGMAIHDWRSPSAGLTLGAAVARPQRKNTYLMSAARSKMRIHWPRCSVHCAIFGQIT
jgi:DNA-binding transcriptional LysR family regulator